MVYKIQVYGYCQWDGLKSVMVYLKKFLNGDFPNCQVFTAAKRYFRATGSVVPATIDYGRNSTCTIRRSKTEEEIL